MSTAFWKGPDCEQLKSTCDNLGAVSSSDVDGKQLYEKSLDCKMVVSSGVIKILSRPEVHLTFFKFLCK